jgi:hypothetical protein
MKEKGTVMIGTWPTPEKPHYIEFDEKDKKFLKDLTDVVRKHDVKGRIVRLEIACGMPPPKPKIEPRCFRICIPGPDDRPYCIWVCI